MWRLDHAICLNITHDNTIWCIVIKYMVLQASESNVYSYTNRIVVWFVTDKKLDPRNSVCNWFRFSTAVMYCFYAHENTSILSQECNDATNHRLFKNSYRLTAKTTRATRTPAFWGYPPPPHDYQHYWVMLDPKSKLGRKKIDFRNAKNE